MLFAEKASLTMLLVISLTHMASVMTFNSRRVLSRGDTREEIELKRPTVSSEKWVPPTFPDLASRTFASLNG